MRSATSLYDSVPDVPFEWAVRLAIGKDGRAHVGRERMKFVDNLLRYLVT